MTKVLLTLVFAVVAFFAWSTTTIDAFPQDDGVSTSNLTVANTQDPFAQRTNRAYGLARTLSNGRNANPLSAAMKNLKEAENDDDKEKAMETIQDELEKQYDEFLVDNEKQIEELQTRLDNLKEQLERRRRAKSKMVELEMERVINESEGLVWPSRNGRRVNLFDNHFGSTRWIQPEIPAREPLPTRVLSNVPSPTEPPPARVRGGRGVR